MQVSRFTPKKAERDAVRAALRDWEAVLHVKKEQINVFCADREICRLIYDRLSCKMNLTGDFPTLIFTKIKPAELEQRLAEIDTNVLQA